jgi:hypothetical protein
MIDFVIPLPDPNVPGWASFTDEDPPVYRWALTRNLGGTKPLVICALNPSTADARKNDQTIRKEIGFAQLWKYTWLVKVNAYGVRATKPPDFAANRSAGVDLVGAQNDAAILAAAKLCVAHDGMFVVAWGGNIEPARERAVFDIIASAGVQPFAIHTNGDGTPAHPLYQPYSRMPVHWAPRAA